MGGQLWGALLTFLPQIFVLLMACCTRKEIRVGAFFATLMTELLTRCEIVRPARLPAYWTDTWTWCVCLTFPLLASADLTSYLQKYTFEAVTAVCHHHHSCQKSTMMLSDLVLKKNPNWHDNQKRLNVTEFHPLYHYMDAFYILFAYIFYSCLFVSMM